MRRRARCSTASSPARRSSAPRGWSGHFARATAGARRRRSSSSAEELTALNERLGAEEGDLLLIVADEVDTANSVLGSLRLDLAERFELIDSEAEEFCWVTDWPMFGFNDTEQRWDALHHPFTAPDGEFDPADPGAAKALAYDIVWNGQELGGGSIRISDPEIQTQALEAIGMDRAEANERFGFLLEAQRYGSPPLGGIAYGLDRMVQRLLHADSIRDVIAFPKAASGADPLTGAPAPVDEAAAARARADGSQALLAPAIRIADGANHAWP